MLGERHRRWCNIKTTLGQRLSRNDRQKQVVAAMLVECWDGVLDGWPTLKQHRFNDLFLGIYIVPLDMKGCIYTTIFLISFIYTANRRAWPLFPQYRTNYVLEIGPELNWKSFI